MSTVIKLRRDTLTNWTGSSYILSEGEFGILISGSGTGSRVTDFRVGDGHSTWAELGNYQNWKPSLQKIVVSGKTASVTGTTASVSLNDVYAASGSRVASVSSSYASGSGKVTINLISADSSSISSSFNISKVPTANIAYSASTLESECVRTLFDGTDATIPTGSSSLSWTGLSSGASYATRNFQPVNEVGNIIFTSQNNAYPLFFDGKARESDKATKDGAGVTISGSYLRTNLSYSSSQTVNGSVNFTSVNANDVEAGSGSFEYLHVNQSASLGDVTLGGLHVFDSSTFDDSVLIDSDFTCTGDVIFTQDLDISGSLTVNNVFARGDVVAYYASDRRLKKNIEPISSTETDRVLSELRPVEFEWNEKAQELSEGAKVGKARGFIADEFLAVLPNAGGKIWKDYEAIDYNQVIPYLVLGYQNLKQEVEKLKEEIKILKNEEL